MTRLQFKRQQVWIYLAAIAAGLAAGNLAPDWAGLGPHF
jgi:hypothetical protein